MTIADIGNTYEDLFVKNRILSMQKTVNLMYAKVTEIFSYEGLPLTIPKRILEGFLTKNGGAVVYQYEDNLFVTESLPGTKPNVYGENTEVTITHRNEGVAETFTRTIGIDAVLVRNDAMMCGLDSIITEYAVMTAQGKITMLNTMTTLRNPYIIQAKDENAFESALEYEKAIRRGDVGIILAEEFSSMEGVVVHSTPTTGDPATQTIELYQYIQSIFYGELGIDLNNNMKSQYVSDSEIEKSSGMPLIHSMLNCRQEALRDIKALFGADITIRLAGEWSEQEEEDVQTDQVGAEGAGEAAGPGDPVNEGDASDEDAPEAEAGEEDLAEGDPEDASDPEGDDIEGEDPEVEPVTEAELVEATEAMLGEGVSDEATDDDPTSD